MEGLGVLLASALAGLLLSAPVGPVALLTIRRALAGKAAAAIGTGLGVATCDIVIAIISNAAWATLGQLDDRWTAMSMMTCGVVFCAIGGMGLRTYGLPRPLPREAGPNLLASGGAAWLEGLLLSACNPVNAAAVAVAVGAMRARASPDASLAVVAGFALGCIVWWVSLAAGVARFRSCIGDQTLRRIDLVISAAIGLGGMVMILWSWRLSSG